MMAWFHIIYHWINIWNHALYICIIKPHIFTRNVCRKMSTSGMQNTYFLGRHTMWFRLSCSIHLKVQDVVDGFCGRAVSEGRFHVDHFISDDAQGPPVALGAVAARRPSIERGEDLRGQEVLSAHREFGARHLPQITTHHSTLTV